jgi:NNP family nitrate/nitrite transporter-like MFS transporter
MHLTVVRMLHNESPGLATHIEKPGHTDRVAVSAGVAIREPEEARA